MNRLYWDDLGSCYSRILCEPPLFKFYATFGEALMSMLMSCIVFHILLAHTGTVRQCPMGQGLKVLSCDVPDFFSNSASDIPFGGGRGSTRCPRALQIQLLDADTAQARIQNLA